MESITNFENQVNDFLYQIQVYMSLTKLFFVFVSIALVILLVVCINLMQKVSALSDKVDKLPNNNESQEAQEQGLDISDKRIKELLILSKSNSKFHADNAKEELELIRQKGETINGTDDVGSNERNNSSS